MKIKRIIALFVCFGAGVNAPIVTMAAEPDATNVTADAGFHTSSRDATYRADVSDAELERLRAQLWALTAPGGTIHCNEAGINAPCATTISFQQAQ